MACKTHIPLVTESAPSGRRRGTAPPRQAELLSPEPWLASPHQSRVHSGSMPWFGQVTMYTQHEQAGPVGAGGAGGNGEGGGGGGGGGGMQGHIAPTSCSGSRTLSFN